MAERRVGTYRTRGWAPPKTCELRDLGSHEGPCHVCAACGKLICEFHECHERDEDGQVCRKCAECHFTGQVAGHKFANNKNRSL